MKWSERLWPGRRVRPSASLPIPPSVEGAAEGAEERYAANPQLALIESYVLDVIGELSPEEVEEAETAVVGVYGDCNDWRHQLRQKLGWTPLMDAVIADSWCRFRKATRRAGSEADPAEFARRFSDEVVRLSRT